MIENQLIPGEVQKSDAIHGIIITTPMPDGRIKLRVQVVQLLVACRCVGDEKKQTVMLVGTQADRATGKELGLCKRAPGHRILLQTQERALTVMKGVLPN